METSSSLKDAVNVVAFGLVAPTLAFKLMEWLRQQKPGWTYLGAWASSVGVSVLVAWTFWGIGLVMLYFETPGPWRAWVESAFAIAWPVGVVAAGLHAKMKSAILPDGGRNPTPSAHRAVLWGVMQARSNKQIARELGIGLQTVKNPLHHVGALRRCLVRTRLPVGSGR